MLHQPALRKGEVITISCSVDFKNCGGKLSLTTERILWLDDKAGSGIDISFCDITGMHTLTMLKIKSWQVHL